MLGDARSGVRRRDVPRVEPLGVRLPWRRRRLEWRAYTPSCMRRDRRCRVRVADRAGGRQSTGSSGCASATRRSTGRRCGATIEYNDPTFEVLWSAIEETGLPVTFHVSTGRDPRAVGGSGGAIVNYVCHSMETTIEPLVQLIASGVFERHPGPARRSGRVRHRVRAVVAGDDGPCLPGASHVGPPGDRRVAVERTSDATASPRSRRITPASTPRSRTTSSTTTCGRTTIPITKVRGRTRRRASSARWANLSDDARAKILGLNAQRIFGL